MSVDVYMSKIFIDYLRPPALKNFRTETRIKNIISIGHLMFEPIAA